MAETTHTEGWPCGGQIKCPACCQNTVVPAQPKVRVPHVTDACDEDGCYCPDDVFWARLLGDRDPCAPGRDWTIAAFGELEASDLEAKIERSSFGTPEAKALRATVNDEQAARIVDRAEDLRRQAEGDV